MLIVAELGTNTNGDSALARQMISEAAQAGVDGIKVQCYKTGDFLPFGHRDWRMFEDARLSWTAITELCDFTHRLGLQFGATPTSLDGIGFLEDIGVDWLKNGSDYLLRRDMIEAMLATGLPTWVAVGMADEEEVATLPAGVRVLACTSAYPCPDEEANLARVARADGYSDHTTGAEAAVMAVALGAEMFEFHFTLSHDLPGPDHHFSRTPAETASLVRRARRAELLLGSDEFSPTVSELEGRDKCRVTAGRLRAA